MCGVGQVRLCMCVCVIRGMPSSCRSAGEIECVVLCRSVCVCVLAVDLLQRVSGFGQVCLCVCVCVCVGSVM